MIARVPSAERREAWIRVARDPYTEEELAESRDLLIVQLDQMASMMRSGWLIAGWYSLADIAVVPLVRRIDEEIATEAIAARPTIAAWWAALQARPVYARAGFGPFVDSD